MKDFNKVATYITAKVKAITHVNVAKNYFEHHINNFDKKKPNYSFPEINKAGEDFLEFLASIARETLKQNKIETHRPTESYFDITRSSNDIGHTQFTIPSVTKEVPYNFIEIWFHKPDKISLNFYNKKQGFKKHNINKTTDVENVVKQLKVL